MVFLRNKKIIIMGGGTAAWCAALYFLRKNREYGLNNKITMVSSEKIGTIGVGEGSTLIFKDFIEKFCNIPSETFLKETKGSYKFGIKFDNWNFDNQYYYHLFGQYSNYDSVDHQMNFDFCQYSINNKCNIKKEVIQRKINGLSYDLVENNKINFQLNSSYSYHFDANLLIQYFKNLSKNFEEFNHIDARIENICCDNSGYINKLILEDTQIYGDFFVNCLGSYSSSILPKEYCEIEDYSKIIPNNSAIALQVKNRQYDDIDIFTTSKAQDCGWSWKIPQYEKTGYGYVYSNNHEDDDEKILDNLIKSFKIDKKLILKERKVEYNSFYNRKPFHKNCLSLGLASGFVEPLEATSIGTTLNMLNTWFSMLENTEKISEKTYVKYNKGISELWKSIFNFILLHYYVKNPKNDYWNHFLKLRNEHNFSITNIDHHKISFSFTKNSHFSVSLGLEIEDDYYPFENEIFLKMNLNSFFLVNQKIDCKKFPSNKDVLSLINR
jgi:tryptophan halogenase